MSGIFLTGKRMYDLKKSEERTNAIRKREGKDKFHFYPVVCGCSCPTCGGWHIIDESRPLPSESDCAAILKQHNKLKRSRDA